MEDNTDLENKSANSSESELKSGAANGSESELSLDEINARLDSILDGSRKQAEQTEQYKEIMMKQQKVIEEQIREIKELKEQNLKNAMRGSSEEHLTVEEIFAKNFG